MRFVLFQVAGHRYALDARQVSEILPLVTVRPIPLAPVEIAGLVDVRGVPIPAIDVTQLMVGRPAGIRLSTRLVIVRYPQHDGGRRLGLIAERVTETIDRDAKDFLDTGVASDRAPYLGPVATDTRGHIQWIDVARLLPPHVRDVLFNPSSEAPWSPPTSKAC